MATNDLTNPIHLPNGIDTANENPVAVSTKIIRQGQGHDIETGLSRIENSIINYGFNNTVIDRSTPGLGNLALNSANKSDATFISIHAQSSFNDARLDEILADIVQDDKIILQQRDQPDRIVIYRVTGAAISQGAYYDIPVTEVRFQGIEFDNNSTINIKLENQGGGTPILPNQFLSEIQEVDETKLETKIDTESTVRFWFRSNEVTDAGATGGTGLLVDESNGDLSSDGDTYQDDSNHWNEFLYVFLPQAYSLSITHANFWVVIKNVDGTEAQRLNLSTNFTNEGTLGTAGNIYYQSSSGGHGGAFPNYNADQTIELFEQTIDPFFDIPEVNAGNVNITRGVKNLPESALSENVQAKLNTGETIPFDDQFKLDQFVESTSTTVSGTLSGTTQFLARQSVFSENSIDWTVTDFDTGLPPSIGKSTLWYIAVPHEYTFTSFTGVDGTTNTSLFKRNAILEPSSKNNNLTITYNVYTINIPAAISGSPTNLVPNGSLTTITEIDVNSLVKIGLDNLDNELATRINAPGSNPPALSDGLLDFDNHITVEGISDSGWIAASNPTLSDVTITRTFAAFWDENRRLTANAGNYFDDLADPTITVDNAHLYFFPDGNISSNTQFPTKQSYLAGGPMTVDGLALTTTYQKLVAFSFRTRENFDGQAPILAFGTGPNQRILRAVSGGLQGRVGNQDGTPTTRTVDILLDLADGSGNQGHLVGGAVGEVIFIVPDDFVAPVTFTVTLIRVNPTLPNFSASPSLTAITDLGADDTQNFTVFDNANPGPLALNVTATYDAVYDNNGTNVRAMRVSIPSTGDGTYSYLVDVRAQGSEDYTPSSTSLFQTINTISPSTEYDVLFLIEKQNGLDQSADPEISMKITVNGQSDNNVNINLPASAFDFNTMVWGGNEGEISISNIQVYDYTFTEPFQIPSHSDLLLLYNRINDWLGQYRHPNFNSRDYTIDGGMILTDENGTTYDVIERFKSGNRLWRNSQSFTAAATSVTADLPTSTTLADFEFVEVTWHTGVGTATDNDNRNYTSLSSMRAIIDNTDTEIILGGRGRGAENYGIEITVPDDDTATDLTMSIVNLNSAGGAVLPTGSLITNVRFY